MKNDQILVLRRLAKEYLDMANEDRFVHNLRLHRAVNDNAMIRPVVLIDELPWHEMNHDGSLTNVCTEGPLLEAEIYLRRMLYRRKYFPADMIVPQYLPVNKVIRDSGIGIGIDEQTLSVDGANHIVSHEYNDQLACESSLEALHPPVITYDREQTLANAQQVGDAIGDILPIRLQGVDCLYTAVWDRIAMYRGVTPLLIDLAERPEYTHKMVDLLTSFEEARLTQYEEQGLLEPSPLSLHCTAAQVSDLPGADYDGGRATRKDIWGRGMAQIFASVSRAMHEEFDIDYMRRTIGTCGLAYYGCCEPLDGKVEIVAKIPNLRKIGLTPWANAAALCEQVAGRYVVAAKPNPAAVAVDRLNPDNLRKELLGILDACRANGCACDIVLKDISTCLNRPQNIFEWARVAMEVAGNY